MHLIDANVWLEALFDTKYSDESEKYLTAVGEGKYRALFDLFHVDAVAVSMERAGLEKNQIRSFLTDLKRFRSLKLVDVGIYGRIKAASRKENLELDDQILLQIYQDYQTDCLVSYDTDFDQADEIKRREPGEIV